MNGQMSFPADVVLADGEFPAIVTTPDGRDAAIVLDGLGNVVRVVVGSVTVEEARLIAADLETAE